MAIKPVGSPNGPGRRYLAVMEIPENQAAQEQSQGSVDFIIITAAQMGSD